MPRYCCSSKGWTENEIAMDYLQWFDKHTHLKLQPRDKRLLLLDGHISHFSKAFIERALELDIVILCYPPHSTHLLQGLDVVLFSRAKAEWTKALDRWERETGEGVSKETFLQVFGAAYIAAFTPENNKKAFEKTVVHPFNRSVIKPKDLVPNIEHSKHVSLPFEVPPCVELFMDTFRLAVDDDEVEGWETENRADGDDGDDDDDESDLDGGGGDGGAHHSLLFCHRAPPGEQGTRVGPSCHRAVQTSRSACNKNESTVPKTPAHQRLRRSLENATPLRGLVQGAPSGSPAKRPQKFYLHLATRVKWTSLPRPASSLADENDMLREELLHARRRDMEYKTCLEASHAQLAIMGMYAQTC